MEDLADLVAEHRLQAALKRQPITHPGAFRAKIRERLLIEETTTPGFLAGEHQRILNPPSTQSTRTPTATDLDHAISLAEHLDARGFPDAEILALLGDTHTASTAYTALERLRGGHYRIAALDAPTRTEPRTEHRPAPVDPELPAAYTKPGERRVPEPDAPLVRIAPVVPPRIGAFAALVAAGRVHGR